MLEETSTSASAGVMASVEDLFWSKTAGNPSVDVSTPSNAPEIHFSSGNPRIEETRGLMHLYRDAAAPLSFSLPDDRKPLICILGVPNHMTYSDFCKFCDSFIQHMLEKRIVRTEGLEDRYSILIRLYDQNSADSFYKHFNGKCFSSLEEETCHMFFTADIQYTGSIEHSQPSTGSSGEQPSCPVCLGTRMGMLSAIGKKHGIAIPLNWKLKGCGTMLETTTFSHVFHGLQVFVSVKVCKGLYPTKSANAAAVLCIEPPIITLCACS